ncbi:protein YhfH [Alteribacter aurantiacus]|uniref:protein YhfH n=1 Tax=Alteribacter aurantiacus TaxID=254410 RepID=UPI00316AE508
MLIYYLCCNTMILTNNLEGKNMIQSSKEFFQNLPPKECTKCGEVFEEMADCYYHQCDKCISEIR